ncbi:MAG: hypothetical protein KTR30_34015, partial [Saprospiraceae bacterium]|nr:hypothetical protein [Saprospiraceae bacterium]
PGDRVIDDLVSLPDLAPTFLEAAQMEPPSEMTAKSLMPILSAAESGLIATDRDFVITGRERHVRKARAEYLPYPQRALRTQDWLYIINFEPERYPMGDPMIVNEQYVADIAELSKNTFAAFGDYDASPTKAWLIGNRDKDPVQPFYQFAFGKRPAEELYAVKDDPFQVQNLAADSAYQTIREQLRTQLLEELRITKDPRLQSSPPFEEPPYAREEIEE